MATSADSQTASQHELAAIMFSDIAEYTAIMGRDEASAMRALDTHRETLRAMLPEFNGRLIGEIGDGTLSSFRSAIDAVNCARRVQALANRDPELRLRIGIHLGDVVFTNNTIIGDGVNVASRLHALAPPGGICISAAVYDEIRNKPGTWANDLGEKALKNVSRPIRVYALASEATSAPQTQLKMRWVALGIGVIGALIGVFFFFRRAAAPNTISQVAGPHTIRSIAILPLDNYSGDPAQDYFADGMTDELTTDLAKISALRVISRGSAMRFKGANRPPAPEIARTLNVDAIVEGSVLRSGDKVRITAQLIDAPADKHLWADSFERNSPDVLALQDELASAIAKEIDVELTPSEQRHLASSAAVNPAAYDAYLKGRFFFNRLSDPDLQKAIVQFEEATRIDPNFAPAWAGLSDAYFWAGTTEGFMTSAEAMPKIKAALDRALQLNDNSAEAHTSLAAFQCNYEYDCVGSEREFRRAIELNPGYAYAHDQFALALAFEGKLDEALGQHRRAAELDPLNVILLGDTIFTLTWQNNYAEARATADRMSELGTAIFLIDWLRGWSAVEEGSITEAVRHFEKGGADDPPLTLAWLGYAYGASGDRAHALAMIEELKKRSARGDVPPFNLALVYLGIGDYPHAMDKLESAYAAHSSFLPFLKMDRVFDPLRKEPRFIALMSKLKLGG